MNFFSSIGIAAGLMFGAVLCLVFFRFSNTDRKVKTNYDERQKAIRNVGYRYAFYTVMYYETFLMILAMGGIRIPVADYALHFSGVFIGCTVLGVYCVWKGAYWGLNSNPRRYLIMFAVFILLNLLPIIGAAVSGSLFNDGVIGVTSINMMVLVMMVILALSMLIRSRIKVDDDEESLE